MCIWFFFLFSVLVAGATPLLGADPPYYRVHISWLYVSICISCPVFVCQRVSQLISPMPSCSIYTLNFRSCCWRCSSLFLSRLDNLHGHALGHRICGDVGDQRLILRRLRLLLRLVSMWVVLAMGGSVALMVGHLALGSHRVAALGANRGGRCIAAMRLRMGSCGEYWIGLIQRKRG